MVDSRRCITALAVLAFFAGLASAQVQGNTPLVCTTNVSVTPSLRVEGLTEQTGDKAKAEAIVEQRYGPGVYQPSGRLALQLHPATAGSAGLPRTH